MSELDDTEASILRAVAAMGGVATTSTITSETGISDNALLSRRYESLAEAGLVETRKVESDTSPLGETEVTLTDDGRDRADGLAAGGEGEGDHDLDALTDALRDRLDGIEGRVDRLAERVPGDADGAERGGEVEAVADSAEVESLRVEVESLRDDLDDLSARLGDGEIGTAARSDARDAAATAEAAAERASDSADWAATQADKAERRAESVADRVDDELRAMRDVRGAVAAAGLLDSSRDAEGRDRYGASDMARRLAALDDAGVVEALAEAAPTEVEAAGEVAGETAARTAADDGVRLNPEVAETVTTLYEAGVFRVLVESVMGAEVPDDAVEGEPAVDGGGA